MTDKTVDVVAADFAADLAALRADIASLSETMGGLMRGGLHEIFAVSSHEGAATGFVAGLNTLDFVVNNAGSWVNPTGLRVEKANAVTLLLACGFGGLYWLRYFSRRR